ncbi:MAG: TlyA family RNA methyltransferase [Verrucomicrobiae bacterium]|nr:TlyA family RNA methyltransferase [Verrucomicrobiae bacterium]
MARTRLDVALVERGLAASREQAQRLIRAGAVRVDDQLAHKPGQLVAPDANVSVTAAERYVSRGGHKLEAALRAFQVDCRGLVCADLGASTGGFTDCLLQHGAARVHAVDVGRGQLAWRLRQDARVVVHDECNARYLTVEQLGEAVDLVTVDVSFISLKKVLPAAHAILKPGGQVIALIKPQFEAGKKFVGRGGVVRDSAVQQQVVDEMTRWVESELGWTVRGVVESPLRGPAGNREFLLGAVRP